MSVRGDVIVEIIIVHHEISCINANTLNGWLNRWCFSKLLRVYTFLICLFTTRVSKKQKNRQTDTDRKTNTEYV